MQYSLSKFGLPPLARELTELSARKRTYVVRTAYAIILYSVASWSYWQWVKQFRPDSFDVLGQGKPLFHQLVRWQFWGVYLSLPLLTCGAIAVEKERQTLQLLRLTKLGSWTILFEKLASRLIAMGTFLLLPLPLAAVAYSMGGVEVTDVVKSVYVLGVTALQIGSFSMLCSAWFRTSTGAMLGTYLIGAAGMFYGSWLLRLVMLGALQLGVLSLPWPGLDGYGRDWFKASVRSNDDYQPLSGLWVFGYRTDGNLDVFTNARFAMLASVPIRYAAPGKSPQTRQIAILEKVPLSTRLWLSKFAASRVVPTSLTDAVICSAPLAISAVLCLIMARIVLWRRAETEEWRLFESIFSIADRWLRRINRNRVTRGIAFGCGSRDLPTDRPIAWREMRRSRVGKAEHLVRMLLLVEMPLAAYLSSYAYLHPTQFSDKLAQVWVILWFTACLIVIVISTGIVPFERLRQELDVVLTTPMTPSEIVYQKLAGIRRIIAVLSVPLLTLLALQLFWIWFAFDEHQNRNSPGTSGFVFAVSPFTNLTSDVFLIWLGRAAAVPVYLSLISWLGFQCGLRLKNQLRAVLNALGILLMACVAPLVMSQVIDLSNRFPVGAMAVILESLSILCHWLNPSWVLLQNEITAGNALPSFLRSDVLPTIWFLLLFHFLLVGGMLWLVRRNALKHFGRFVGRMEPATQTQVPLKVTRHVSILEFETATVPSAGGDEFVEEFSPDDDADRK